MAPRAAALEWPRVRELARSLRLDPTEGAVRVSSDCAFPAAPRTESGGAVAGREARTTAGGPGGDPAQGRREHSNKQTIGKPARGPWEGKAAPGRESLALGIRCPRWRLGRYLKPSRAPTVKSAWPGPYPSRVGGERTLDPFPFLPLVQHTLGRCLSSFSRSAPFSGQFEGPGRFLREGEE